MTISDSPPRRFCRRATAAISVSVRPGVSSMRSGAALISADFSTSRRRSSLEIVPLRSRWPLTPATEQSRRSASSMAAISRLTNSTGWWLVIATCSEMFIAIAVFPMLGRAARITSSELWSPPQRASSSVNPVSTPPSVCSCFMRASIRSSTLPSTSLIGVASAELRSSRIVKIFDSARERSSFGSSVES